ncbi:hypothetical protein MICAER10613_000140 [Microcystis aeruginosa]
MLISDISYLENVSEKNIEGSGSAVFTSGKLLTILAQADAIGVSEEGLFLNAQTGNKTIIYGSTTTAVGLV